MYLPDLTLGLQTYSLITQRTNASIRSDASQPVSEPNTFTISHESASNGRRSSVAILDDSKVVSLPAAVLPTVDTVRMMLKVQYNPLAGRTDNEAAIATQWAEMKSFFDDPANLTKFINQET